jgi:methyl-accepting chemotaxis protein
VRITYPSSTLDQRVRSMWVGLALFAAAVAATVAAIGVALAQLVTRPVTRLQDAARRLAGDLTARAEVDRA